MNALEWPRHNEWEDSLLAFDFDVRTNLVMFKVRNKIRGLMQIRWKKSFYKLPGEENTRIMNSELEYEDRTASPADRVLLPMQQLKFFSAPASRTEWNGKNRKWRSYPILKGMAEDVKNQFFSINFCIVNEGKEKEYLFTFKVVDTKKVTEFDVKREKTKKK